MTTAGIRIHHATDAQPVVIELAFPCETPRGPDCLERTREAHQRAAEKLELLLENHLPGGTYDALFGLMAQRKATLFVVSHGTADESEHKLLAEMEPKEYPKP